MHDLHELMGSPVSGLIRGYGVWGIGWLGMGDWVIGWMGYVIGRGVESLLVECCVVIGS